MSNLSKLEFLALGMSGKNYLSWILDAEIHLNADSLGNAIIEGNDASPEDRSKALIFLRRHLDESLTEQYLMAKDRCTLWMELKALFQIVSHLKLCEETITESELLEKTYSTSHASNLVLQQQYRERQFKKYSEFISCLLVVEQNNELLMQNHQTHPTGSSPIPIIEANATVTESGGKRHEQFINKKKGILDAEDVRYAFVANSQEEHMDMQAQEHASVQGKNVETNFAQFEVPNENAHFDLPDFKATTNHSEFDNIDTFIGDV
ncbi:uncharacterized protein LOC141607429 [Silene latifolia]|uniref:uncharacterized protein LOC141607429 n=1 Tax=Silene latifolia TaxID=37657 RepID=UPI003D76E049